MSLNIASSIDFSKFSSTDWNEHPREPRSNSLLNEISRDLETATCARSGSFGLVQRRKLWTVSRRKEERYREEWSRGRAKIDAPERLSGNKSMESGSRPIGELVNRSSFPRGVPRAHASIGMRTFKIRIYLQIATPWRLLQAKLIRQCFSQNWIAYTELHAVSPRCIAMPRAWQILFILSCANKLWSWID